MKNIILAFVLFVFAQPVMAGTVFTTKTDNGSTVNLTDVKPCHSGGEVQDNTAIAYLIVAANGFYI